MTQLMRVENIKPVVASLSKEDISNALLFIKYLEDFKETMENTNSDRSIVMFKSYDIGEYGLYQKDFYTSIGILLTLIYEVIKGNSGMRSGISFLGEQDTCVFFKDISCYLGFLGICAMGFFYGDIPLVDLVDFNKSISLERVKNAVDYSIDHYSAHFINNPYSDRVSFPKFVLPSRDIILIQKYDPSDISRVLRSIYLSERSRFQMFLSAFHGILRVLFRVGGELTVRVNALGVRYWWKYDVTFPVLCDTLELLHDLMSIIASTSVSPSDGSTVYQKLFVNHQNKVNGRAGGLIQKEVAGTSLVFGSYEAVVVLYADKQYKGKEVKLLVAGETLTAFIVDRAGECAAIFPRVPLVGTQNVIVEAGDLRAGSTGVLSLSAGNVTEAYLTGVK